MLRITMITATLLAAACIAPAAPARELTVPADKGWKHAATGIILKASLLGLARESITDNSDGDGERDIYLNFSDSGKANALTIYIFHPAAMSVPLWFDRSQTAIEVRDIFGGVTAVSTDPVAFAPPRTNITAGLRQVYTPRKGPYRATGLVMMPLGDWLVAIRLSSTTLDPAALDAKLTEAVTAIGWPANAVPPTVGATPIHACPDTLSFKKARLLKPDMMQALLGGAAITAATKDTPVEAKPVSWCRQGEAMALYAVYRADGDTAHYTLALGDSGRVANVGAGLGALMGKGGFEVSFSDVDGGVAIYPSFDRLPQPTQVVDLILHGNPISRVTPSATGSSVTIGSGLVK